MGILAEQKAKSVERDPLLPRDLSAPTEAKGYMDDYLSEINPADLTAEQAEAYEIALRTEELVRQIWITYDQSNRNGLIVGEQMMQGAKWDLKTAYQNLIAQCPVKQVADEPDEDKKYDIGRDIAVDMSDDFVTAVDAYTTTYMTNAATPVVSVTP